MAQTLGWNLYDPTVEYGRMDVPNSNWKRTDLNASYEVRTCYVHNIPCKIIMISVPNSKDYFIHVLYQCHANTCTNMYSALLFIHVLYQCYANTDALCTIV